MKEKWYDIKEYGGYYQISNKFNVRSLDRYVPHPLFPTTGQFVKGRILKQQLTTKGYLYVTFQKEGINEVALLHRLIGQVFIPNPKNKPCINHKNGIKTDNRIENLEWVTYSENIKHAFRIGLKYNKKGIDDELSVPIIAIDLTTNKEKLYGSQREASRELGIAQSSIWRILNNQLKRKKYNYHFKYANTSISI